MEIQNVLQKSIYSTGEGSLQNDYWGDYWGETMYKKKSFLHSALHCKLIQELARVGL